MIGAIFIKFGRAPTTQRIAPGEKSVFSVVIVLLSIYAVLPSINPLSHRERVGERG
jgi:hypothetical protein